MTHVHTDECPAYPESGGHVHERAGLRQVCFLRSCRPHPLPDQRLLRPSRRSLASVPLLSLHRAGDRTVRDAYAEPGGDGESQGSAASRRRRERARGAVPIQEWRRARRISTAAWILLGFALGSLAVCFFVAAVIISGGMSL